MITLTHRSTRPRYLRRGRWRTGNEGSLERQAEAWYDEVQDWRFFDDQASAFLVPSGRIFEIGTPHVAAAQDLGSSLAGLEAEGWVRVVRMHNYAGLEFARPMTSAQRAQVAKLIETPWVGSLAVEVRRIRNGHLTTASYDTAASDRIAMRQIVREANERAA